MVVPLVLKLICVIIDGLGDLPIEELGNRTPLDAAETPNLDFLAANGKTGMMYSVKKGIAPESDVGVISVLGYDPFKYSTGRGVLEAVGIGMQFRNGDLALRCNFATLGAKRRIIDRRAGRDITVHEATRLSKAINEKVKLESYPVDFAFKNTIGHRAVLTVKSRSQPLSGKITNTDPGYVKIDGLGVVKAKARMMLGRCRPLDNTKDAKISAELVNEFTERSHAVLEDHPVNIKRAADRKLKANLVLTRDAGHILPKLFNISAEYGVNFASLTDMPVEKGIAKLAGMTPAELPFPSGNLEKDCEIRLKKLIEILPLHDCFYIHLKGPDEPAHDGNFELKTQMISTIDKQFFGGLLRNIRLQDFIVSVTADHSTPCMLRAHSDDPVPLFIAGGIIKGDNQNRFSEEECANGSLGLLQRGTQLMPLLMRGIRSGQI